jgi:hypothetical protein
MNTESLLSEVRCEICGYQMTNRINGSHLRTHNISLAEYILKYPHAATGSYTHNTFTCKICNEVIPSNSSSKRGHLNKHGITIDEYNIQYEMRYCECGCGNITEYSYKLHRYLQYVNGHYTTWNKGLNKSTYPRLSGGGWNKGLTKFDDARIMSHSYAISLHWRSGSSYENATSKYKSTMIEKYGVTNFSKTVDFKERAISSSLQRYGVAHPMQSVDIFNRSKNGRYKFKVYTWPSGETDLVQGYEPYALDILLETFNESDIIVDKKKMPEIWYYREDSNRHRYYPDIWIPSLHKFIEIKSKYTLNLDNSSLYYKRNAIISYGYNFEVWVIEKKKIKEII